MAENEEALFDDELFDEDDESEDNMEDTYLVFTLEGGDYAIRVAHVKEIVRLPKYRPVPDVPDFIRGVINLRGRVVPLMDARSRLGLAEPKYSDRTVVIVLESNGVATGLVADGVNGVSDFPPDTIEPHTHGRGGRVRAVEGIAKKDDEVAIILDAAKLLESGGIDSSTLARLSEQAPARPSYRPVSGPTPASPQS